MRTVEELLEENNLLQNKIEYLEGRIKLIKLLARMDKWKGIDGVFEPDWYVDRQHELKVIADKLDELFRRNDIV